MNTDDEHYAAFSPQYYNNKQAKKKLLVFLFAYLLSHSILFLRSFPTSFLNFVVSYTYILRSKDILYMYAVPIIINSSQTEAPAGYRWPSFPQLQREKNVYSNMSKKDPRARRTAIFHIDFHTTN